MRRCRNTDDRLGPCEVHAVTAHVVTRTVVGHVRVRLLICGRRWKWRWLRLRSLSSCIGAVDRSNACHRGVLYHGLFGVLFGTASLTIGSGRCPSLSEATNLFLMQCCADSLKLRVTHLEEELLHPRGVHIPVRIEEQANKHRNEGRGQGYEEHEMSKCSNNPNRALSSRKIDSVRE